MTLVKRGEIWWYDFQFGNQRIRESTKSTSKVVAKAAEQQRRRDLEHGFHNITEIRENRIRLLRDVAAQYLDDYRLRFRGVTFAEYAIGHVTQHLGDELLVDIDEAAVLGYQSSRLKELAAPKSVNEEVRFLLTMMEQQGDVIRASLRKKKKLKIPARRKIGKAYEADETHRMRQLSKKSRSPHIYLALSHSGSGEEWADDENAMTSAEAQAFKRACSCFGLGRYFYNFAEMWVDLNENKQPKFVPNLPAWALPKSQASAKQRNAAGKCDQQPGSSLTVAKGPFDASVTKKIEGASSGTWAGPLLEHSDDGCAGAFR